jgi:hypothetical protein
MTMTTNTQANAAGILNYATGYVVTNADAAAAQAFTCGFVPRKIRWVNVTDRLINEWYNGMASPSSVAEAQNGDKTLETTNGITVGSGATVNTFTVAAAIIVASKTHVWEAFG